MAAAVLALHLGAGRARADVVEPPPAHCPPGHTPRTGHEGPYCDPRPLPRECPPDYQPRVIRRERYCEPPPPRPCPPGSYWTSSGADHAYCRAAPSCDYCPSGQVCINASLCVRVLDQWPDRNVERVSGICHSESDCPEGERCLRTRRCDITDLVGRSGNGEAPSVASPPAGSAAPSAAPAPPESGAQPPPESSAPVGRASTGSGLEPPPAPAQPTRGCAGCEVGRAESAIGAWPVGVALLLLAVQRRRWKGGVWSSRSDGASRPC
jgi:hypothetical protein